MGIKKGKGINWYVIVFIVVNLIGLLFIVKIENRHVNDNMEEHLKEYESEVENVMTNYLHSFQLFSHMLSKEIENTPDPNEIWDYLKSVDQKFLELEGETFDGLYMYYQGRYLYSWDTPYSEYENTGYDATTRPWYQDAIKGNGAIVFTPPYMSYANHYILSTISQLQPDGQTVFAYDIKMGDIQDLVTSMKNYDDEQVMIFDSNGTIIGSSEANYLGSNLQATPKQAKRLLETAKKTLDNSDDVSSTQKEKLQKQVDYTQAFYDFQNSFNQEYQYLDKHRQQTHFFKMNNTYYYSYLVDGQDYSYVVLVPFLAMLKDTIQIWLVPLLSLELLLIYILSRINKGLKNRELQAAYVELGQTQRRLELALSVAQKAAAIDELTGMMNLKSFRKAVIEQLDSMSADEKGILIMIDGDHFKNINDEYGHLVGDEVIKLAAQMIVGRIRTVDLASRLHGDEYAIFIADTDDYHVAKTIMNDINVSIAKEVKKRNMPLISLSAGAVVAKHGDNYTVLAKLADDALYQAKQTHNGAFCGVTDI